MKLLFGKLMAHLFVDLLGTAGYDAGPLSLNGAGRGDAIEGLMEAYHELRERLEGLPDDEKRQALDIILLKAIDAMEEGFKRLGLPIYGEG